MSSPRNHGFGDSPRVQGPPKAGDKVQGGSCPHCGCVSVYAIEVEVANPSPLLRRQPHEKRLYRGFTIEIHRDDNNSVNDALGGGVTLFAWHRRYSFGDPPPAWATEAMQEGGDALCAAIIEHHPDAVILPVFMYEHSGVALSTGPFACRFDSGQLGVIFAPVFNEHGELLRSDTEAMLRAVVEEANERAQGNVWGYVVRSPEGDEVNSCWGYVGNPDSESFLEDAEYDVECEIERRETGEQLVAESFAL